MKTRERFSSGCLILFLLPFCAVGIVSAALSVRSAWRGNWGEAGFFLVFALVFGGAGFGLLAWTAHAARIKRQRDRLEEGHPAEPWLWRRDWAAGRIRSAGRARLMIAWIFGLFWNVISVPLTLQIAPEVLERGNDVALFALIFPVVGVALLAWAILETLRYRRYGLSVFRMARVPAPVGRLLKGVIVTHAYIRPAEGIQLTLSCVNRITRRSGKETSTSERVLWQEERKVSDFPTVGRRATAIPVAFAIPSDAVESSAEVSNDQILWRLEARADVPGVDYVASFEVPVFRTPESDEPMTREEQEAAGKADEEEYRQPPESRIYVTEGLSRTEIHYSAARNLGVAVGLTIFFLIWTGITFMLPRFGAPIFFPIVFGFFDVLIGLALIGMWLGTTRVQIDRSSIRISRKYLGLGWTKKIPAEEIDDIVFKIGMQSGSRVYYDIKIVRSTGRRWPAGGSIRDKREAEWLIGRMMTALGWEERDPVEA